MKYFLTFFIAVVFSLCSYSQQTITGKIVDFADRNPLVNASIVLLNADSILQQFTRADDDGVFIFKNVPAGKYLMISSYPKYELISKPLELQQQNILLEPIALNSQMNIIEEVIVNQRIPIKLKGDTIEYDAASFETEKNAKLEDLLRRLPGLTVSADGQVTAQGKSVSKVLIDGEEFFGYDSKIAIRNIRADGVDKVQVYERKSERAELTGVDDGERLQTVNVVLKEEARRGVFGNIEALAGSDALYASNLFAAKFNQSERIAIQANSSNIGATGREGSLRLNSLITGNPQNTSLGANYENRILNKKVQVNGNYNFSNNSNNNTSKSYNKQIIPDTEIQETQSQANTHSSNQINTIRSQFKVRLDSTQNMDIHINGNTRKQENGSNRSSKTNDINQVDINAFTSSQHTQSENSDLDLRLNYRKKLNSKGASLNIFFQQFYSQGSSENMTDELTYFHRNDSSVAVRQERLGETSNNNLNGQINFNDKLTQQLSYSLGYSLNKTDSKNFTDAFNINSGTLDSLYSQQEHNNSLNHGLQTSIFLNLEKISIGINNQASYINQGLSEGYRAIDLDRNFWDNALNMNINYRLNRRKTFTFSYRNSKVIPRFEQLQPIQPQLNTLFQQLGNPDLKRSTNNTLHLNYHSLSLLKGTNMSINAQVGLVQNPIINKREIDQNRVTRSTFVNIDNRSSLSATLNGNYNKPVFDKNTQLVYSTAVNYRNSFSYIRYNNAADYVLNTFDNINVRWGAALQEQNSKALDYDANIALVLNNQKNSLQQEYNYTNLGLYSQMYLKYFLPKTFTIATNINYSVDEPTKFYTKSIQQFYINLDLSKKLLKNESLVATIRAYDLFNTYNTTNRNASESSFSESTQQAISSYVMLGLKWDFSKNFGTKKND